MARRATFGVCALAASASLFAGLPVDGGELRVADILRPRRAAWARSNVLAVEPLPSPPPAAASIRLLSKSLAADAAAARFAPLQWPTGVIDDELFRLPDPRRPLPLSSATLVTFGPFGQVSPLGRAGDRLLSAGW